VCVDGFLFQVGCNLGKFFLGSPCTMLLGITRKKICGFKSCFVILLVAGSAVLGLSQRLNVCGN